MSLTAAASGFVLFLLSLPVIQGTNGWSVDYTSTQICAPKGSEWKNGIPGTTLTVTAVEVHVNGQRLACVTRCNPSVSSYVWYINGEQVDGASSSSYEISNKNSYDYENSYSCALKGFEDFHSPLICHDNKYPCNKVTYTKRSICTFKGSSVEISCTYSNFEDPIKLKSWFRSGHGSEDLRTDSQYEGRVEVTEPMVGGSNLRIRDLRESDSAEYHFKFKTQSFEWKNGIPGTTLTVAALQVKVSRISVRQSHTEAELTCLSSCRPAGHLSFVWFKNNQLMPEHNPYQDQFNPGDIISCAFKGHEDYRSAPVYIPKLPSVSVSPSGEIVEGSSVTLTCSSDANPAAKYTWYKEDEDTPKASGQNFTLTDIRPEHSGSYYCVAQNTRGHQRSTLLISVLENHLQSGSWKSAAFASITVVFLAFIILLGIILIRRKRCLKANSSIERTDNRAEGNANDYYTLSARPEHHGPSAAAQSTAAEQQDDLCYTTVRFVKKREEPDYYNIIPNKPKRQNEEDKEREDVEYTHIQFGSTQRLRHQQAVECSSAVYGTVNRK